MNPSQEQLRTFLEAVAVARAAAVDDCWEWTGKLAQRGYGRSNLGRAHVAAYKVFVGNAPRGLVVAHTCRKRNCVNPQHLQLATTAQNNLDRPGCQIIADAQTQKKLAVKLAAKKRRAQPLIVNASTAARFWHKVEKTETCWLWRGTSDESGYGRFCWKSWAKGAHVVAYYLGHGVWPKHDVAHTCHQRSCVRPEHLKDLTRADHMAMDGEAGRFSRKHMHKRRKLSDDQVKDIKKIMRDTPRVDDRKIADGLHVTAACVRQIRRGETYQDITVEGFVPCDVGKGKASASEREIIHALRVQGKKQKVIAQLVGRSQGFVSKVLSG